MVVKLTDSIVRGEIDNRTPGRTVGRLWLSGREEPLELTLDGNCWRDLAGSLLSFRNPTPVPYDGPALATRQTGVIGDMTASKRVKVETNDSITWHNVLSLEWFGADDGRLLIESGVFVMELCERLWDLDRDSEEAQKLVNLQAMRDHLASHIKRRELKPDRQGSYVGDEFEWEQRLRESERMTEAYREAREKFAGDPDEERKQAFAMGWDALVEKLAHEKDPGFGSREEPGWSPEEDEDYECSDEDDEDPEEVDFFTQHPIQFEAHQLAARAEELARSCQPQGTECRELPKAMMFVATKLAGALNGTMEPETGFVIALLKRCIDAQNRTFESCSRLIEIEEDPDHRRALEALRDEMFLLRQRITNFSRELRGS